MPPITSFVPCKTTVHNRPELQNAFWQRQRNVPRLIAMRAEKTAVGPEPPADVEKNEPGPGVEPEVADVVNEASPLDDLISSIEEGRNEDAIDLAKGIVEASRTEVETSQSAFKKSEEQLLQLKDQYRRLQADFENFRSRADSEKAKTGNRSKMNVLQDLLPVVDNFEIAAKAVNPQTDGEEKIYNSYQNLYKQVVDTFRNLGLEAVSTVGEQFDPEVHDGVMREESDSVADGEVLEEFRKGFMFKGELLRPAMVKVAVSTQPDVSKVEEEKQESE